MQGPPPERKREGVNIGDRLIDSFQYRILVAGSRSYDDRDYFEKKMLGVLKYLKGRDFCFVSGKAPGVDTLIIEFCEKHGLPCFFYSAFWDYYGKPAGSIRNIEMSKVVNLAFLIWDGISPGTQHMLSELKKRNIKNYLFIPKT